MKVTKHACAEATFPYIAYISENLSDKPALIIQLHGAGERGNGTDELDKVLVHGFPNVVNDSNFDDCILIMPQCPKETFWVARLESLKKFIDEMIVKYNADENRIYLCGISMGGYGTWYLSMAHPETFAAIAPCCGGGMAWHAPVLTMPIWAFHGLNDETVLPRETIEMIDKIKPFNPNAKCTLYEGVGHNSWEKAFSEELLEWMLAQKK